MSATLRALIAKGGRWCLLLPPPTTTIKMMVERRTLQVLVELLVGMMLIGTPSKRMRSECWSFFFSSFFGALC